MKPAKTKAAVAAQVLQICSSAVKALLSVAQFDLRAFQDTAGAMLAEVHHVIAYLVESAATGDSSEMPHERCGISGRSARAR